MNGEVIKFDDFRSLHDIVKQRIGTDKVIFGTVMEDGNFATYVSDEIDYKDLVLLIDCLIDRKQTLFGNGE